jgi:hypothetical protein
MGRFGEETSILQIPYQTCHHRRPRETGFVKREAIGAESLEDSAFAFVPSRWIVVRPKTSSSKLEARLHIA